MSAEHQTDSSWIQRYIDAWNSHDGSLVPTEIVAGSDGTCTVRVGPRGYVVYVPA